MKRFAVLTVFHVFAFSIGLKAQCSDFITVGTAMYDGDCLQMTVDSPSQAGCAWQPDKYDFSLPIDVQILANFGTDNGGADGICMVFQLDPAGLSACGPVGGAIASGGITNSLIIEFDTWENANFNDPPLDHVAVNINGDMGNPISPIVELGNIEDGQDYTLRFTWNPLSSSYAVYFDNSIVISGTFDIPANCFGGATEVYYGFTSSTGAAVNNHVICPVMEYINAFMEGEICAGEVFEVNGEMYSAQGQYTQMLVSEEDCDTVLFIDLTVHETYESISGYAICEGDSIEVDGEVYFEEGIYVQEYTTGHGCDSILTINLTIFPKYEEHLNFTINSGENIEVGGEEYSNAGSYIQEYTSNFGCDSIVYIHVSVIQNIVYFSLDSCEALSGTSNNNYEEFTPVYPENLDCGSITSSILYRDNPEVNLHSCTYGIDGNPTMCVGALDVCSFDPESDKAVRIDLVLNPDPDSELSLSGFSFFENSPENFNWINGNSGPNNYPTLYGIAVYKDGSLIYQQADIPTTNVYDLQSFDFSDEPNFAVTEVSSFQIVLLGYCLIGNGSPVAAWDLDEVNIFSTCSPLPNQNGKISGRVLSPSGIPVQFVAIKRTQLNQQPKELVDFTDEGGFYAFEENPGYFSYELNAFKNNEKLKGVTTLDLLLIQKHLLETNILDSPEKWIAADINNSKSISSLDILLLRKLILGIDADFPEKRSWEFIPTSQTLSLDNPWNYSTTLSIDQLLGNIEKLDFTAIKIGDVNSSYSSGKSSILDIRDGTNLTLGLKEQTLVSGNTYKIPVYLHELKSLQGFQFALNVTGVKINDVVSGQVEISADHFYIHNGQFRIAWDNREGIDINPNEALFSLEIYAESSGMLSAFLQFSESVITPELYYGRVWTQSALELVFEYDNIAKSQLKLGQNKPNPFEGKTYIPIDLTADKTLELYVFDIQGRTLLYKQFKLPEGEHDLLIDSADLSSSGILFYSLRTDTEIQVRRMLVLD